jgi:hypothetical protein
MRFVHQKKWDRMGVEVLKYIFWGRCREKSLVNGTGQWLGLFAFFTGKWRLWIQFNFEKGNWIDSILHNLFYFDASSCVVYKVVLKVWNVAYSVTFPGVRHSWFYRHWRSDLKWALRNIEFWRKPIKL